jgi:hypothetical protein
MSSKPAPLLFVFLLSAAAAGETLVSETFDKFDVKALPAGWSLSGKDVAVVPTTSDRGKVLRIASGKGETTALAFTFDLAKVAGHSLRFSVLAQLPGPYEVPADKPWAKPRVFLTFKSKDGKDVHAVKAPAAAKPEWQPLSASFAIPKDAQKVTFNLRSDFGQAEVFFDNLTIDMDLDLNAPPPVAGAAPAKPVAGPAPAKPAEMTSAARAAAAPKKVLEDGGIVFNPEIAVNLQKRFAKPSATAKTILLAGPGLPNKEFDAKPPATWTLVHAPKEIIGPGAGANALLIALAETLTASKPEVVILVGESGTNRKPAASEEFDWSDVARLCMRLGAVPVFGIPAAASEDPENLRKTMQEAAEEAGCPAVELKVPSVTPKRIAELATLLEKHVFCRVPLDAPASGVAPKKTEDE